MYNSFHLILSALQTFINYMSSMFIAPSLSWFMGYMIIAFVGVTLWFIGKVSQ